MPAQTLVALVKGGMLVEDSSDLPNVPWNPKLETKVIDKKTAEEPKVTTMQAFLKAHKKEHPAEMQGKGPISNSNEWVKKRCKLKWTPGPAKKWAVRLIELVNQHLLGKGRKRFDLVPVVALQEGCVSCVGFAMLLGPDCFFFNNGSTF